MRTDSQWQGISVDPHHTDITGEEDEEPALELKNIKLFVKRGKKNFSNGMIGSIKLLANKSTNSERLRESLSLSLFTIGVVQGPTNCL